MDESEQSVLIATFRDMYISSHLIFLPMLQQSTSPDDKRCSTITLGFTDSDADRPTLPQYRVTVKLCVRAFCASSRNEAFSSPISCTDRLMAFYQTIRVQRQAWVTSFYNNYPRSSAKWCIFLISPVNYRPEIWPSRSEQEMTVRLIVLSRSRKEGSKSAQRICQTACGSVKVRQISVYHILSHG